MTTCPCGGSCACHSNAAYPPPCSVPGGCGLADQEPAVPTCTAAGCEHPQAAGSQLCALDGRRLGDWLAQLGDEYARLTAMPSMQGRQPGTGSSGGLASHRNPGQLDVMVLRDRRSRERSAYDPDGNSGRGVLEVLFARAAEVREGRQLVRETRRLPAIRVCGGAEGPVCDVWCAHPSCVAGTLRAVAPVRRTVRSERKLLADHLDWILGQDWAGEFFDEIRDLFGLLRSSNGHGGGRAPGMDCMETVDGIPCTGRVSMWQGKATCSRCGTSSSGLDVIRRHSTGAAA